jgi:hypothetical protein
MLSRLIARFPTLIASLIYALTSAFVFWPLVLGRFLVSETSDQRTGYAFREFAAAYFRDHGSLPEWSPYLFGGIPFVANTAHGDTFFPTFLLRLAFGTDTGVSLSFAIFTCLCGIFAFLFLRSMRLGWGAAFVGGAAYMLGGAVVSLASPGHDGKLYVSALLPLALMFLYRAAARRDWTQYLYFGVTVGFSLLSPHFQLTYYLLMAAGFFWLFMVFFSDEKPVEVPWWRSALLFIMALGIGFALSAVQLLPFIEYIPYSPRGAGGERGGYTYGTTFSMPPEELLGAVWPAFVGILDSYWGRNFFKLHSDYLGVTVLILATFAFFVRSHRRMMWFFVFLAVYGLLFSFGGHTPFYAIPYAILPGISKTRAPGMMFFLPAFSAAVLCALGTQRIAEWGLKDGAPRRTPLYWWMGVLALAVVLAVSGGFKGLMNSLANMPPLGQDAADPRRADLIDANYAAFTLDALRTLLFGAAAAGLVLLAWKRRWPADLVGLGLGAIVLADLWSVERHFVRWSPPARELFAADPVVQELKRDSSLYRVLPVNVYGDNYLHVHRIRSALGYHGNQLQDYNELLGGMGVYQNIGNPNVMKLIGVKYLLLPSAQQVPGLTQIGAGPYRTWDGESAYLYRLEDALPYGYLVPQAVRVPDEQIVPTLIDPRFDPRRLALVPQGSDAGVESLSEMPEPLAAGVTVREVREGLFRVSIPSPVSAPTYLVLAENWYPSWSATVDGQDAPVLRAQNTLLSVALPAGAREVELVFRDRQYRVGAVVSLLTAALVIGLGVFSERRNRRRRVSG